MNTILNLKSLVVVRTGIIRRCCSRIPLTSECCRLMFLDSNKSRSSVISRQIDPAISRISFNLFSRTQNRNFYLASAWRDQEVSSKVEKSINNLKEEKKEKNKEIAATSTDIAKSPYKEVAEKKNLRQKFKAELLHYYHGFRLLGLDMKISAKLLWRVLRGNELTRRENKLLIKTTGDVFRLIPFSVFIIVPFMELLLPVFIKLFPGMLPSTFQTASDREDKLKQALKVKIEVAKFLQKTLDDMAVQASDHRSVKAKEFAEFFNKIRLTGGETSNEEIMKFSKLFEDDITLDSLSRDQLFALCRVLDITTLGNKSYVRFLLRTRLRNLTADDRLIARDGVDTLSRIELQQACKARGMRAYGMPENRLKNQLVQWLDLSIHEKVPPSLLLLSRALMVPDAMPMSDKLKATISSLPHDVLAPTKQAIGEKEGKMDHRTKIEIIKIEEKKILEERAEENKPEPDIAAVKENVKVEITTNDVKVIKQALDSIEMDKEMAIGKKKIKELKAEMAEYQEDMKELDQINAKSDEEDLKDLKVSKGAKLLFKKVNAMISQMDKVLQELEKSEEKVKKKIETLKSDEKDDKKVVEELIRIDELIGAIKQIQSIPDEARLARISKILDKFDDDGDGAVKIENVLKVIQLIGKEDGKLDKKQVNELIEMLGKEEILGLEDKNNKSQTKDISNL